jgi:hypothetical protein
MKHIKNFFVVLFDVIVETRKMQAKNRFMHNGWY